MVEVQVKNEEFSKEQIQIMQKASEQLNTIIQKQPNLKDHQVTIAQENGKMFLYIKTNDGQPINEKFGEALHKAVLDLKGKEFVAAGMALQKGGCDAKEFERVSKDKTSQQALHNLLTNSSIGISKETSEEKGEGEGKGAKAYAFTNQELIKEEKAIKQKQFDSTHITKEEDKELVEELHKKKDKTASNKNAIYMATEQGQQGAVKAYCNKQIQDDLIKKQKEFNEKFNELSKHNNDKFKFEKEENKIYVTMVHHDGKSKREVLYDENGLNRETALNLYEVANVYTKHKDLKQQKRYDKIRNANDLNLEKATEIRNLITEMVFSNEEVQKAFNEANKKYKEDNPGYYLSKHGFAAGYLNEVLKVEERKRKKK